jgi:hypothetical protein
VTRRRWVALLVAASLTVLAGRWAKGLFTTSEFVHFSVNFPTEPGLPVLPVAEVGGPWALKPELAAEPHPAGGLLVWGREGRVVVDLDRRHPIKWLVQPRKLLLSTHWLRNVGPVPRRLGLDLELCGAGLQWITFERDWDQEARLSTRAVEPGATFNMDWVVTLTPALLEPDGRCDGLLQVTDADTGELLTRLPLSIVHGGAP